MNPRAASSPVQADQGAVFLPGPVLLLGAPGVGKGTQAQALMAEFDIPQISTGDLLRQNRRDHTPLGLMADELMRQGQLVPDDLVNSMVAERLKHPDAARGYILDGFPRTLPQAAWLDHHLALVDPAQESSLPVIAVSINVAYDQLLQRITGRRTCSVCKHIYNVFSNPPKVEGRCDFDNADLEQRADDTEDVFAERMKTFQAQTAPVIEHYRMHGRFEEIDGEHPVAQVTADIQAALRRLRGQKGQD